MRQLSNQLLVDTYLAAINYKLDKEFIKMLASELQQRGLIAQSRLKRQTRQII